MDFDLSALKDTWIGHIYDSIAAMGPQALLIVGVVGVVVLFVVLTGLHIAKGGGQYGIIEGYVGTIGAGKTTLAVQHALLLAKARNAVLLSNIPVICGPLCKADMDAQRESHKGVVSFVPSGMVGDSHRIEHRTLPMNDDGLDLAALTKEAFALRDQERGLVLLMDEVGVIMPARLWKDFSVGLMWILQQSRKLSCEWIWTAQDASFVDHQLRTLTAVVHHVKSLPPPSIWRRAKGKRPWFLVASVYTPMNAPRANGDAPSRVTERRLGRRMVRYRRAFEAAFDTDGVVLPSKHLKGAEAIRAAAMGDAHAVDMGGGFGPTIDTDTDRRAAAVLEVLGRGGRRKPVEGDS